MTKLSLTAVLTAMTTIADGSGIAYFNATEAAREALERNSQWLPAERRTVESALQQAISGTQDALGLEQVKVPAEFAAAAIAMFVKPINWMAS